MMRLVRTDAASRLLILPVLLLIGGALATGPFDQRSAAGSGGDSASRPAYTSHYLVFGARDASGTPRFLALDFNRTEREGGQVAYEYKLFVARGADWSMPVYETWTTKPAPESPPFPARGGLKPTLTEAGHLRAAADLPDLTLDVRPQAPTFPFPTGEEQSAVRTGHPRFVVQWNDTTYRGPGVYERIRPVPSARPSPEAAAEAERQLDEDASFGLYDWIVLYDEEGRLWQVSQGTLTADFAYQRATEALPAETHDVLVRWTATERDETAQQHRPTAWLVDVPAWDLRVRLRRQGEHLGHGAPREDGTRPIYVQAGVEGRGLLRGTEHRFFGMVEHIRD